MSWKRNHCLLKYTLCEANKPVNENVNTMAPTRDCIADRWSANTKMKMTGKNEKRLITTRSIGSRRSGRASKSPMYRASRILDLNRSPHDLDERVFEARRFERDLALLAQAPLDNREDLFRRSRFEYLRRRRSVARGRLYDDAHPQARISFRLLHGPEESGASLVHDEQVVREDLPLVQVVPGQETRRALSCELPQHVPDRTPAEGIQPDRGLVEEQNLRVRDHRHRDDETLTKTARQVRCELVAVLPQAEVLHDLLSSFAGLGSRLPADEAEVEDVIVGRQEHLRSGLLGHHRDVRADRLRLCQHVVAEDGCAAHGRLELSGEDPQECRLPRAVAAEQAKDFALLDREGNVLEGFRASWVRFPEPFDADDLHAPRPTGACYLRLLRGAPRQLLPRGRNGAPRSRGRRRTPTSQSRSCRKSTRCGATRSRRKAAPRRCCETTIPSSCTPSTRSKDRTSSRTKTRSSSSSRGARRRSSSSSTGAVPGPATRTAG